MPILDNKSNALRRRAALKGSVKSNCFLKPIILGNSHIVVKFTIKPDHPLQKNGPLVVNIPMNSVKTCLTSAINSHFH